MGSFLSSSQGKKRAILPFVGGLLFSFTLAGVGYGLSLLPGLQQIGPLILAILLAVIWRQVARYPDQIRPGVAFASRYILRAAIILYGFRLDIFEVLRLGPHMLLLSALAVVIGVGLVWWLGKKLQVDPHYALLLGAGTGICGAAAIAAVSPIIEAREEKAAMSIGIIALMGTLFALLYTALLPLLPFTISRYGMWTGLSLHEIAHVAAAAAPAGEEALTVALMAKLGRVLLLVPFCFLLSFLLQRKTKNQKGYKVPFPWFLIGFLITSFLGSFLTLPPLWMEWITHIGTFLLATAMVGLGLNVQLRGLGAQSLRLLLVVGIASVLLSAIMTALVLQIG